MRTGLRTSTLLAFALLGACGGGSSSASSGTAARTTLPTPAEPTEPTYADTARALYEDALEEFRGGDCMDAEPIFRRVRREFPYSRYAALSDLRVGDCQVRAKSFPEAIQTFGEFVRYRPSHPMVSYARFKIAECHFKQIPTDWFLAPPSHERDLGEAQEALRHLRRFILDFPEDEHVEEALRMARRSLAVLAGHELYVARFYWRREAYPAVVRRLETLLRTYEGCGLEDEALLLLGDAFVKLRLPEEARSAYQQLVARFPEAPEAGQARSRIGSLPPPPIPPAPAGEPAPPAEGPDSAGPSGDEAPAADPAPEGSGNASGN
ncbi:MAG: outer membrane protein assembly factor BamD [Polyangiales bacterium]